MKNIFVYIAYFLPFIVSAQSPEVKKINAATPMNTALMPFHFLAADELMGRSATRPEIHIAARFIAEYFRSAGVKQVPGAQGYYHEFQFPVKKASSTGHFTVDQKRFDIAKDIVQFSGVDVNLSGPVVYAGYGTEEDLKNIDVNGKIVVTELGTTTANGMDAFHAIAAKQRLLQQKGAKAVIERFRDVGFPFDGILQYALHEHTAYFEAEKSDFPVFFLNDKDSTLLNAVKGKNTTAVLSASGNINSTMTGRNVIGWIEGTDPKLKNQYIALTAHYDHVGVAAEAKVEEGKRDSIYNGARDNAIGTTAILNAAKYFAENRPKRSLLFIAWTAEEMGLVGSNHYADSPLVPFNKVVYNLNIDNASYNDTTIVTVIGLGRTSADTNISKAAAAYGLKAMPDPAPEQNLFDRSDNVNFAMKGVPAPTFSLGIRKFDEEIMKRYHQLSDEIGNFNLNYGLKYIRAYILAAQNIANDPKQPIWKIGDKYESVWKELYRK